MGVAVPAKPLTARPTKPTHSVPTPQSRCRQCRSAPSWAQGRRGAVSEGHRAKQRRCGHSALSELYCFISFVFQKVPKFQKQVPQIPKNDSKISENSNIIRKNPKIAKNCKQFQKHRGAGAHGHRSGDVFSPLFWDFIVCFILIPKQFQKLRQKLKNFNIFEKKEELQNIPPACGPW